jgi:transporter family-2 protein
LWANYFKGVILLLGIIFSLLAGALMSFQGVFNTRLSDKIGNSEANMIIQGSGFLLSLILFFFIKSGNLRKLADVNRLYLLGGVIGVLIVYTVIQGMRSLGPAHAVGIILISQLLTAAAIDTFGLFDTKQVSFHFSKIIGLVMMILGVIVFKFKG